MELYLKFQYQKNNMETTEIKKEKLHNLLIIDDEPEVIKSLTRLFRRDYNIFSTTNAEEGLKIMDNENIQVIVSDQRMPGITGVEFFSKIRVKYPDAVKLILTGYSDIEAVKDAINKGQVFRYITKPWDPYELENVIKEAFDKSDLITKNQELMISLKEANKNLENKVKERTKELEEVNTKLSELNIEKNKYIGMVTHDLRSPIGTAQSFSALLIDDYHETPEETQLKYLGIINERCNFSLDLIDNFLNVSKIESGVFDLKLSKQNYVSFVKDALVQERIMAEKKSQEIIINCPVSDILITFDVNKIQQVISNLVSNSIKYSMPGTKIFIDIELKDDEIITKVTDQGQGIPEDELPEIFKPFKITSVKATANEKSIGLGLAIVKKIVEAHNGKIEVYSKVGEGTSFVYYLPFKS